MTPYLINTLVGVNRGSWNPGCSRGLGEDANFGIGSLGCPKIFGTVRLASNNPDEKPLIDPGYYSYPDDIQAIIDAMKFLYNIYENTTVWKKHGVRLAPTLFPGCKGPQH